MPQSTARRWRASLLAAAALLAAGSLAGAPAQGAAASPALTVGSTVGSTDGFAGPDWTMGGQNLANTRSNPFEHTISTANAGQLAAKWHLTTHGDVSATPAVVGGAVYLTDWGGYVSKLDAHTGQVIWSHQVSDYAGVTGAISRTSPAVVGDRLYIGDMNGAHLYAIDTRTGQLVWSTQLDTHTGAILTQSPVVFDGVVYQGVSSSEEQLAGDPSYPCCSFRGSFNAISADTGKLLWRTYTIPDNGGATNGYSGGAVWGSTPAIDPRRGLVYITTGNNYEVPASVQACEAGGKTADQCTDPNNHIDSILALDLRTGALRWSSGSPTFDAYNSGCFTGPPPNNCPTDLGQDWDFAQGAQLFTVVGADGRSHDLVGAGQKSGVYWALDRDTGAVVWSSAVLPGSADGGMMWGSATDGKRIYVAGVDAASSPYTLPNGQTITYGSFAALDPATGKILWQVADPSGGHAMGALTVANGVVYGASLSGHLYAFDAATGTVLWDYQAPGASVAGPAVVDGTAYWGDGYSNWLGGPSHATDFYAFTPGGH
ncbi:PQQ-binding-like beta-propeller repeat protein [Kitasatospora viridis]|uniref:Polyvinyl alcohol dehydrogenase (Cytochrome) n=1 Tax=Kitasatospora viridis TaxID=281105 RepID=A0A561UCI1_9ACTN|nr:PQQ-binding-like beta-propeller repeat protein [Kitasatospora viridis]TWF97066.1 polyvinyl alcohol dehydrogenase (cytochrome) [Kitasatospora viridis]